MEIDLLCNLFDHLCVTEVSRLPCKDEDLHCRYFGRLSFSGVGVLLPTFYNTSPVACQEQEELCNLFVPNHSWNLFVGFGLYGSTLSAWDKVLGLPWCSPKVCFGAQCYFLGLLFLGRQLKRDFFLFLSYSAVRMKNDWLVSGYFEERRWSDIPFYILWRYRTVISDGLDLVLPLPSGVSRFLAWGFSSSLLLVFNVHLRRCCSCSFYPIEFLRRSYSGGGICYSDQSLFLYLSNSKDLHFVSLLALLFNLVSPSVSSPAEIQSSSASVNFPGNIRLFGYYVSSVVQGDAISVIGSNQGLFCIFLFALIPCLVVRDVMMVCLKKGDDLLRQNWYPKFEIHSSGTLKSFDELFRRPNEDEDQFWPFGIFPCGVFITSVIKNVLRVVNHAPTIQTHPYVCGMLRLLVTSYFWIMVTEFWFRDLGSVNHLVSLRILVTYQFVYVL